MYVKEFDPHKDLKILNGWLMYRDHSSLPAEEVPAYGFMVWVNDLQIATAFLRRVEGGYAQLDGLATNPFVTSELRSEAIDLAVLSVFEKARELGIKSLYSLTKEETVIARSRKFGFVERPYKLIAAPVADKSASIGA